MAEQKWGKYLVNKPGDYPDELKGKVGTAKDPVPGIKTTHLITATDKVIKGVFYVDTTWLWKGAAKEPVGEPHTHTYSQVVGFIGGREGADQDLDGEITMWLDGHQETFTKNHLVFIPAGVVHGPFMFTKINRPVLFLVIAMNGQYSSKPAVQPAKPSAKKKYSLMDHTKENFSVGGDFKELPRPKNPVKSAGARILHIEDDMIPGAFYVDVVKIYYGDGTAPAPEHVHEWPELLAMVGADPDKPRELEGEMGIWLEGEHHITGKSSYVCIPAGVKHCPWEFRNLKSHTVIFSAGPQGEYSGSHKKDKTEKK
jgi:mannose-6-phosphate isomerase-like protein (cupin superfamily)